MSSRRHEFRDPVHTFIRADTDERRVIDSKPVQRLRHIHQLATTFLVYPGATHRRFEHSLGVMELAGRAYEVITQPENLTGEPFEALPQLRIHDPEWAYWRRVIRMAGLCHDLGHLPFSHAAEKELLPKGWSHEKMSRELILGDELMAIWTSMKPPVDPLDVVKLAVGEKGADDLTFSPLESILSEVIVGDALGVDRMDYLLRDSVHAGVAYGRFDHNRLLDTLRILSASPVDESSTGGLALGVSRGGLESAEALVLARYFMYTQVYFHRVRMIYDIHLIDFLRGWLDGGAFSTGLKEHQALTDNEVIVAMRESAENAGQPGHEAARRLMTRDHFVDLYTRKPADIEMNPDSPRLIFEAAVSEFGPDKVRWATRLNKGGWMDFPVQLPDGDVVSSLAESEVLDRVPVIAKDYVYVDGSILAEAKVWLENNKRVIIEPGGDG